MGSIMDNIIIAGDYKNKAIATTFKGEVYIVTGWKSRIYLDKETVENYEVQDTVEKSNTSGKIKRGLLGGIAFGGAGAIVGASTSKNRALTRVAVNFKDGKRSLLQMDKSTYDAFLGKLF